MKNYLKNWNFMRFLRLVIGIYIVVIGIQESNFWLVALGASFSIMPLLNIGCCGVSSCNIPVAKSSKEIEDVTFTEVK